MAALSFAESNPGAPRDVCIASGSACGASATFEFGGTLELVDGVGLWGRYESTGFSRCDDSETILSGVGSNSFVEADRLPTGPTTLDGLSLDVEIYVERSTSVIMNDLIVPKVTLGRALSSRLTNSTIGSPSAFSLEVTDSGLEVSGNVLGFAQIEDNGSARVTGNLIESDGNGVLIWDAIGEFSGNTIVAVGAGVVLDACTADVFDNEITGSPGVVAQGCGSATRVRENTIVSRHPRVAEGVFGYDFALTGNDILAARPSFPTQANERSTGVYCGGCTVRENRIEASGGVLNRALVFEDDSLAERNLIISNVIGGPDTAAVRAPAGTLRNNLIVGAVDIGTTSVEHNTIFGPVIFGSGIAGSLVGNIIRTSIPLQQYAEPGSPPQFFGLFVPPWERLIDNDLLPGTQSTLFRAIGANNAVVSVSTIAELEQLANPFPFATEAHGNFSAEPQFSSFGHLSPGSPCIDAGSQASPGEVDFDGEPRTGPRDVGADELGTTATCGGATCTGTAGGTCLDVGPEPRCYCGGGSVNPPSEPLRCEPDACFISNGGCHYLTECTNTFPGRTCGSCPAGFTGSGDTGCVDIDECQTNNGACDPLASCQNNFGGHTCGPCPNGHSGTGATGCTEIDECQANNGGCDPLTQCTNTPGTRLCGSCPTGYSGNGYLGCTSVTFRLTELKAGGAHTCGIDQDGALLCWGFGQYFWGSAPPPVGRFVRVAPSAQNTCAIRSGGAIECWGENNFGQGDPPSGAFTSISSGDSGTTCATRADGSLACWGANFHGQANAPSGSFAAVAVAATHACAIRLDGTVTCWGSDASGMATPPTGTFVALGLGSELSCGLRTDGTLSCWGRPDTFLSSPPSGTFVDVATFAHSACALRADGTVLCWGNNSGGQLDVPNDPLQLVALGGSHGCGLRMDDTIVCWGNNGNGQAVPPKCAPGYAIDGSGACVDIDECQASNGGCDVLTVCSNLLGGRTCGDCPSGYLGTGETGCAPDECAVNNGGCDPLATCTNDPGGPLCGPCPSGYLGDGDSGCFADPCVVDNGGCDPLVSCDGASGLPVCGACPTGYLGTGATGCALPCDANPCEHGGTCADQPDGDYTCACPASFSGKSCEVSFTQLSVGDSHTCGLRSDDSVLCWGLIQLGAASVPAGTAFRSVSAGLYHGCGIRESDGGLTCWGSNSAGQATPPPGAFTTMASGRFASCAVRTDGALLCWGSDGLGSTPAPPGGTYTSVGPGVGRQCAIKTDGTAVCFGQVTGSGSSPPAGTYQAVGSGLFESCGLLTSGEMACWDLDFRQALPPPGTFTALSVGFLHACAIRSDGTLTCWGEDVAGETSPPPGTFKAISAGFRFACAIRTDDAVLCWGTNDYGQLDVP